MQEKDTVISSHETYDTPSLTVEVICALVHNNVPLAAKIRVR